MMTFNLITKPIDLPSTPTIADLEPYIVERGEQWDNEPTLTLKLGGLEVLLDYFIEGGVGATPHELAKKGYLGCFLIEEDDDYNWFHILVPEVTKI